MSGLSVFELHRFEHLQVSMDGRGVAVIGLNRPAQKNALSMAMIKELHQAAVALGTNDDVRVVVLTGSGSMFCSGGDLQWMESVLAQSDQHKHDEAMALGQMLDAFHQMPKPLIAQVRGGAYGGGIGLMSVADIAIVASDSQFSLSEVKLGVIPATIAPYVVARIGAARARSLMITGRRIDAEAAYVAGLADIVCAPGELDGCLEREVRNALTAAPHSAVRIKKLLAVLPNTSPFDHVSACVDELVNVWNTPEAKEGVTAFLEKRHASWNIKPETAHAKH